MGRGRRGRIALSDRDWPRRLPVIAAPEPLVATIQDRQALAELKGLFVSGYTSEDVTAAAPLFERAFGLSVVCVWDYVDWSTGGSSEVFFLHKGRHYSLPEALAGPLYADEDCDEEALAAQLAALAEGEAADSLKLVDVDEHNKALEDRG